MKNAHFFLASAVTWCTTGDRTLTEAIKLMESEKLTFCIWYVPLPPDATYPIDFYVPSVEGAEMIEMVEYRKMRRIRNRK